MELPNYEHLDLSALRWAALDLETTGVFPKTDGIVEIGIWEFSLALDDPAPLPIAEFQSLVHPGRPIPPVVQNIHGIDDAMVAQAPRIGDLLPKIAEALEGRIILAHNAGFDMAFLAHAFSVHSLPLPTAPWICTLECSRYWDRHERYHNLTALRTRHQLTSGAAHRALSDAQAAAEAFVRMLAQRSWKEATLAQLPRLARKTLRLAGAAHDPSDGPASDLLQRIESAVRHGRALKMTYTNRQKKREERVIDPQFIYYSGTEPMLAAFCRLRQERRHFQIKRMEAVEPLPEA